MSKEPTSCRVCGETSLVGYFGLCQECHDATVSFWQSRRRQLKQRVKDAEQAAAVEKARKEAAHDKPRS